MARTFHRKRPLEAVTEINVTPLLDLAFALLIIFMIAAPLLEQTIEVNLPQEAQRPQQERAPNLQVISVDAQGQIYWGETPVSLPQLNDELASAAARAEPPVLAIRGDREVPYQHVINVIDAIKTHQLTRITLDTQAQ